MGFRIRKTSEGTICWLGRLHRKNLSEINAGRKKKRALQFFEICASETFFSIGFVIWLGKKLAKNIRINFSGRKKKHRRRISFHSDNYAWNMDGRISFIEFFWMTSISDHVSISIQIMKTLDISAILPYWKYNTRYMMWRKKYKIYDAWRWHEMTTYLRSINFYVMNIRSHVVYKRLFISSLIFDGTPCSHRGISVYRDGAEVIEEIKFMYSI